ncbi:MAG: SulP family inorganic anion transporter [Hyphomicrobiaceae bacterium]
MTGQLSSDLRRRLIPHGPSALPPNGRMAMVRDAVAGVVASLVLLAYCLSFSALIFAGRLSDGLPMALWSFMLSTAIVTLLSAYRTTLAPMLAGPRNPVVAVMAVLAATISAAGARKGMAPNEVARHILVAISIATLLTATVVWALGRFRLGQAVRFVPYPVVGGFLAASGALLVVGGIKLSAGAAFDWHDSSTWFANGCVIRVVVALAFAGLLLRLKTIPRALPVAIVLVIAVLEVVLAVTVGDGMIDWHLAMTGGVRGWSPLSSMHGLDWGLIASAGVEIVSIAAVSIAALLLDASSLEVQRRTQADLDTEFHVNGAANLGVVALGGFCVGIALNPSRLTDLLGGIGRVASIAAGVFVGLLLVSGIDFASFVPRPALGGILIFLGVAFALEALKVPGRSSRAEFALTLLIMAAIVGFGYLTGIILGIVSACLLFAARYSRIGVIRRHVTRAQMSAPVERRPEVARLLTEQGNRIHILWLSGYLFFGSSNGLFENIRSATASRGLFGRRWVVLDCSDVSGIDGSAVLSFQKLANWASAVDVTLAFAGANADLLAELSAAGLFGGASPARHFSTRNEALEWSEDQLIESSGASHLVDGADSFDGWLGRELGPERVEPLMAHYLERRELEAGEIVCALGAPADTIELIASGSVAVIVPSLSAQPIRVRRMTGCTVVGEMGFFRGQPRAASVIAEEPAVVYVLTRAAYERLRDRDPALCATVLQFVVRALSDRLEAANREIGALLG